MIRYGTVWYPPIDGLMEKYGGYSRVLSWKERVFFSSLLKNLSGRKYHIEEAMAFCIHNISSAFENVVIISTAFVEICTNVS